ncbi:MAG: DUF4097 family beta strand repeat protein [Anaerolineales bacterium]|nr:DUF4097 family beta strand repeat protein [Anaerolineales bacterium]
MKRKWIAITVLILALLGVGALVIYTLTTSVLNSTRSGVQVEFGSTNAFRAEADEEQILEVSTGAGLVVTNTSGDITILGGENDQIVIEAHKLAYGDSQAEANADLEEMEIEILQQGNTVSVRVVQPEIVCVMSINCRPDTVNFTIYIPEGTSVQADTGSGNVDLTGTNGTASLNSHFGDVLAEQVEGDLEAHTNSGNVIVKDVRGGSVDLQSDFGDISLNGARVTDVTVAISSGDILLTDVAVTGDIVLGNDFGQIDFHTGSAANLTVESRSGDVGLIRLEVQGALVVQNDFGQISLEAITAETCQAFADSGDLRLRDVQVDGAVELEDDFGQIEFNTGSAAALSIDSQSGNVTLTSLLLSSSLDIRVGNGNLTVQAVEATSYHLASSSGTILADGVRGAVTIENEFGDITVRNGEDVTLDLTTNSGDIDFYGTLGAGPHALASDFGSILLVIPANTALSFELETDFGSIYSAIEVTISGEIGEDQWVGNMNGGGASLSARTNSGDIRIETLNP